MLCFEKDLIQAARGSFILVNNQNQLKKDKVKFTFNILKDTLINYNVDH